MNVSYSKFLLLNDNLLKRFLFHMNETKMLLPDDLWIVHCWLLLKMTSYLGALHLRKSGNKKYEIMIREKIEANGGWRVLCKMPHVRTQSAHDLVKYY